jgi:hypothetical protein
MTKNRKTKSVELHAPLAWNFVFKRVGRQRNMELPDRAKFKEKTNHC